MRESQSSRLGQGTARRPPGRPAFWQERAALGGSAAACMRADMGATAGVSELLGSHSRLTVASHARRGRWPHHFEPHEHGGPGERTPRLRAQGPWVAPCVGGCRRLARSRAGDGLCQPGGFSICRVLWRPSVRGRKQARPAARPRFAEPARPVEAPCRGAWLARAARRQPVATARLLE